MNCFLKLFCSLLILLGASLEAAAQEIKYHALGNAAEAIYITVDGEFEAGLSERFREFAQNRDGWKVLLNSPGGLLIEGIKLGLVIRELGYHTGVGRIVVPPSEDGIPRPEETTGECESACALAYLGGKQRYPSKVGFHRFSYYGGKGVGDIVSQTSAMNRISGESQIISALIVHYMVEMGIDARLFSEFAAAGHNEMRYLDDDLAVKYGVFSPFGFDRWFIEPYKDGIVAASRRLSDPVAYDMARQTTIFCKKNYSDKIYIMITGFDTIGAEIEYINENNAYEATLYSEHGDGIETQNKLAGDNITLRNSSEDIIITMALPRAYIGQLLNARKFSIRYEIPRSLGGYQVRHHMQERDAAMIRSALRHCF